MIGEARGPLIAKGGAEAALLLMQSDDIHVMVHGAALLADLAVTRM